MAKKFYEITLVNYDENNVPVPTATVHCINFGKIDREEVADFCHELGKSFEAVTSIEEVTEGEVMEYFDNESDIPVLNPCPFCEQLRKCTENDAWYKENSPRHKDTWTEYRVALVTEGYSKDYGHTGTVSYNPEELNFCPTCGKRIEK